MDPELKTLQQYVRILARGICECNMRDIQYMKHLTPPIYKELRDMAVVADDLFKRTAHTRRSDGPDFYKSYKTCLDRNTTLESDYRTLNILYEKKTSDVHRLEKEIAKLNKSLNRSRAARKELEEKLTKTTGSFESVQSPTNGHSDRAIKSAKESENMRVRKVETEDVLTKPLITKKQADERSSRDSPLQSKEYKRTTKETEQKITGSQTLQDQVNQGNDHIRQLERDKATLEERSRSYERKRQSDKARPSQVKQSCEENATLTQPLQLSKDDNKRKDEKIRILEQERDSFLKRIKVLEIECAKNKRWQDLMTEVKKKQSEPGNRSKNLDEMLLQQLEKQIKQLQEENSVLNNKLKWSQKENSAMEQRIHHSEEQKNQFQYSNGERQKRQESRSLPSELHGSKTKIEDLPDRLNSPVGNAIISPKAQPLVETAQNQNAETGQGDLTKGEQSELQRVQSELRMQEEENKDLQERLRYLQDDTGGINHRESRSKRADRGNSHLHNDYSELRRKLDQYQRDLHSVKSDLRREEDRNKDLQQRLDETNDELKQNKLFESSNVQPEKNETEERTYSLSDDKVNTEQIETPPIIDIEKEIQAESNILNKDQDDHQRSESRIRLLEEENRDLKQRLDEANGELNRLKELAIDTSLAERGGTDEGINMNTDDKAESEHVVIPPIPKANEKDILDEGNTLKGEPGELQTTQSDFRRLEQENKDLEDRLRESEAQMLLLQNEVRDSGDGYKLKGFHSGKHKIKDLQKRIEREKDYLDDDNEQLQKKLKEYQRDLRRVKSDLRSEENKTDDLQEKLDEAKSEIRRLKELEVKNEKLQSENAKVEERIKNVEEEKVKSERIVTPSKQIEGDEGNVNEKDPVEEEQTELQRVKSELQKVEDDRKDLQKMSHFKLQEAEAQLLLQQNENIQTSRWKSLLSEKGMIKHIASESDSKERGADCKDNGLDEANDEIELLRELNTGTPQSEKGETGERNDETVGEKEKTDEIDTFFTQNKTDTDLLDDSITSKGGQGEFQRLQSDYRRLEQENKDLEERLRESQAQMLLLQNDVGQSDDRLKGFRSEKQKIKHLEKRIEKEKDYLDDDNDQLQRKMNEYQRDLRNIKSDLRDEENKTDKLQEQLDEANSEIRRLKELEVKNEKLHSENAEVEESVKSVEGEKVKSDRIQATSLQTEGNKGNVNEKNLMEEEHTVLQKVQAELQNIKEERNELQNRLQEAEAQLLLLQNENSQSNRTSSSKDENALTEQVESKPTHSEKDTDTLSGREDEGESKKVQSELLRLQQEHTDIQERLRESEAQILLVKDETRQAEDRYAQIQRKFDQCRRELKRVKLDLQNEIESNGDLQQRLDEAENDLRQMNESSDSIAHLRQEKSVADVSSPTTGAQLKEELQRVTSELERLQAENTDLQQRLDTVNEDPEKIQELEAHVLLLENQKVKVENRLKSLQSEKQQLQQLQSQLKNIERTKEILQDENSSTETKTSVDSNHKHNNI